MAFVNRMLNDEGFRERVLAHNRHKKETGETTTPEEWAEICKGPDPQGVVEDEDHHRYEEIKVIAQALAFRDATAEDVAVLERLVNTAYGDERSGQPEGFNHQPCTNSEMISAMVQDQDCEWLLVEEPLGEEQLHDRPRVLGCCCYSVGGAAAATPDKAGAIRLLAVDPLFRGLCVGRRLLMRVKALMEHRGCVRMLCCIPEHRQTMRKWAKRRGFQEVGTANYPEEISRSFSRPTSLVVVAQDLNPPGGGGPTPTVSSTAATASDATRTPARRAPQPSEGTPEGEDEEEDNLTASDVKAVSIEGLDPGDEASADIDADDLQSSQSAQTREVLPPPPAMSRHGAGDVPKATPNYTPVNDVD